MPREKYKKIPVETRLNTIHNKPALVTSFQHPAVTGYRNISYYVFKVNEKRKKELW